MEVRVDCETQAAPLTGEKNAKSRNKEFQRWKQAGGMQTFSLGGRDLAESLEENQRGKCQSGSGERFLKRKRVKIIHNTEFYKSRIKSMVRVVEGPVLIIVRA